MRGLRISIAAVLLLLTLQGWTGDFANLFAVFPTGAVEPSLGAFWQAVVGSGVLVAYHAVEATLLITSSLAALVLSLRVRVGRLFTILGTLAIVSAAIGGVLFVLSGFQDNANSAQMGGSFIGAYAFYFLALYSTKGVGTKER